MRYGFATLLVLISSVSVASAQGGFISLQTSTPQAHLSADDVIARVMSFDRDRDGRIAAGELSERMQALVARGDSSGDGALDVSELRTLAASQQFVGRAQHGLSGYGFGDTGQSSRNHIENSIDDLRLSPNAREEAKRIAVAYVSEFEGAADVNLRSALAPLISADKLPAFERDIKALARLSNQSLQMIRFTATAFDSLPKMVLNRHQLSPEQMKVAEAAIETFRAEQQLDGARRSELVYRLRGLLTAEEGDNLSAAIARRPLVKSAGVAGIQRVSAEGFTITPVVR